MTSHKSSINTFWFTFRRTFSGNFIWPLCGLAALFFAFPFQVFLFIKSSTPSVLEKDAEKIQDTYKFILNAEPFFTTVLAHIVIVAASMILAISIFRFITSKKTVNVYYSLGITRKNLYLAKYLAGAIMLFLMIAIPFLLCLFINLRTFGSTSQLWNAFFYQVLGHFALSFFCFSLTAAVFSCVGTIFEGAAFSLIVLSLPNIVITCLEFLMNRLVWGSAYGQYFGEKYHMASLSENATSIIPFKFFTGPARIYAALTNDGKENPFVSNTMNYFSDNSDPIKWTDPNYYLVIGWVIAAALIGILGLYLFHRRKAEICGFLGKNKVLNFVGTFALAFFAMCILVNLISQFSIYLALILGLLLYTLIYCVIDFALIRNFREFGKGFVKLPLHLATATAIFLIFSTGLFGFSSRVPNIEDIESIAINSPTSTSVFSSASYSSSPAFFLNGGNYDFPIDGFKTKEDIEKITSLHKKIIADGNVENKQDGNIPTSERSIPTRIQIVYNLKNGNKIRRQYEYILPDTYVEMLSINTTTLFKEKVTDALTKEPSDKDEVSLKEKKLLYRSPSTSVVLISKNMDSATPLTLTQEQRMQLLNALAKDITAQTAFQAYIPEKPAIGAIQFIDPSRGNIYYEKEMVEYAGDKPVDTVTDISEMYTIAFDLSGEFNKSTFLVTEDMKNTIQFLKDNDVFDLLNSKVSYTNAEIISAYVEPSSLETASYQRFYYYLRPSTNFVANWYSKDYYKDEEQSRSTLSFKKALQVTNASEISELDKVSHMAYFTAKGGYYVRFTLAEDAGYVVKFIPAKDMPKKIAQSVEALGNQQILGNPFGF